jgi:hypothetical protein
MPRFSGLKGKPKKQLATRKESEEFCSYSRSQKPSVHSHLCENLTPKRVKTCSFLTVLESFTLLSLRNQNKSKLMMSLCFQCVCESPQSIGRSLPKLWQLPTLRMEAVYSPETLITVCWTGSPHTSHERNVWLHVFHNLALNLNSPKF